MKSSYEVFNIYYYYTWADLIRSMDGMSITNPYGEFIGNLDIRELFRSYEMDVSLIKPIFIDANNTIEDDTFYKLLIGKYFNSAVIKTNQEVNLEFYVPEVEEWLSRMMTKIIETQDKYISLIRFYNLEKEKLLAPISSSLKINSEGASDSRTHHDDDINNYDLPSNAYASQSPSGLDAQFVSQMQEQSGEQTYHNDDKNSSNQISEDDRESKIKRLNEIDTMYKNTLKDWVGEFSRLFYEEINY